MEASFQAQQSQMKPEQFSNEKTSPALSRDIDNRWTSKVTEYEKLLCDGCFDLFHFGHANAFR